MKTTRQLIPYSQPIASDAFKYIFPRQFQTVPFSTTVSLLVVSN